MGASSSQTLLYRYRFHSLVFDIDKVAIDSGREFKHYNLTHDGGSKQHQQASASMFPPTASHDTRVGSSNKQAGTSFHPVESGARTRAIHIFPELEDYQWFDDYFTGSEHEIIAVLDHTATTASSRAGARIRGSICGALFLASATVGIILRGGFIVIMMFSMILCLIFSCGYFHYIPPHTAVTAHGIVHVKGWKGDDKINPYFFPYTDIFHVSQRLVSSGDSTTLQLVIMLTQPVSTYQTISMGPARDHKEFHLQGLVNPTMFEKLVMAIRDDRMANP